MNSTFRILAAALLISSIAAPAYANDKVRLSAGDLTDRLAELDATIYYGGFLINSGETVTGPIVVVNGSLDIQSGGVLNGDAWVVNGVLVITGGGRIDGRVELVNSENYSSRRAVVTGGVRHYNCECEIQHETYEETGDLVFRKAEDPWAIHPHFAFDLGRPTRVRYDIVRLGVRRESTYRVDPYVRWDFMVDVPVYAKTQRGFLGFTADATIPLPRRGLDLVLRGYKTLHTEDQWRIGPGKNTILLLFFGEERVDYYEKRGGDVGLHWQPTYVVHVEVTGFYQDDVSMKKDRAFVMFGGTDDLPPNPSIEDGTRFGVRLHLAYDTRDDVAWPGTAWRVWGRAEGGRLEPGADGTFRGPATGGGTSTPAVDVYNYRAFSLGAGVYRKLPRKLHWSAGARLHSTTTRIPMQLSSSLGGDGGVRGTNDAPFDVARGDRLALVSTELRVPLPRMPVLDWVFSLWDLVLFGDIGYLKAATDPGDAFAFLGDSLGMWRKSVGAGIAGESLVPYFGIYVAQELDTGGDRPNPRVTFVFERSF